MTTQRKPASLLTGIMICLLVIFAGLQISGGGKRSMPGSTPTSLPKSTFTPLVTVSSTFSPTATFTKTLTITPTIEIELSPSETLTQSNCQLLIHGTYNFPGKIVKTFTMGPGTHYFYNRPGGGKYSNDQAACELNYDCTQLRAINKDSAEPNPKGVEGSWVDSLTGISTAKWNSFVVECKLGTQ